MYEYIRCPHCSSYVLLLPRDGTCTVCRKIVRPVIAKPKPR